MLPARHRLACLFGIGVLLLVSGAPLQTSPPQQATPAPAEKPKLAVLVYFDQLRGDYLTRWESLFVDDGFHRLCHDGAWFQDCHYPYSGTLTGPGHASVATGCSAEKHGIVLNDWYDRVRAKEQYCVATDRYESVPVVPTKAGEKKKASSSPDLLLSPTLADALKAATGNKGKVVALSLKDRSAVLPGGKQPDACYWADKNGQFMTSTYYRDSLHPWVRKFNQSKVSDRWFGKVWDRVRPTLDYAKWSGRDDVKGEGGKNFTRAFPHTLDSGPKKQRTAYYEALATSPFGNEVLLELARAALDAEKLGQGDTPDLLCISFSSNDLVGHAWGPDSQEVLDATLRTDLIIRDLLKLLDAKVGKGRYTLALTADHGICPLPEVSRSRGLDAARLDTSVLKTKAEQFLADRFPEAGGAQEKGSDKRAGAPAPLIQATVSSNIYLNRKQIQSRGLALKDVQEALAGWLTTQTGVQAAYSATRLQAGVDAKDALGQQVRKSFHPDRSGDVVLVSKPYYLFTGALSTGTTHGSPHSYDTHVPLVVFGAGVIPGIHKERVTPQAASVILAHALGIPKPRDAEPALPSGLFR